MDVQVSEVQGVRIAIEGCGHGTLHAIYASVEHACKEKNWPGVDLLIICGDFQAVRNAYDLNCVSMPPKYRQMGDFHEYYSGHRVAPYLTIFVGGNHEASNYLFELYFGGWVAPNIYYMGAANVLRLGPLRIAGMSGIYKPQDYHRRHHEVLPYSEDDKRSIYHTREIDVRKLLHIRSQVDIGISHDWPQGIVHQGDFQQLFKFKPFLRGDAESNRLGSAPASQVMDRLRPRFWFSAHLHCKYTATRVHDGASSAKHPTSINGTIAPAFSGPSTALPSAPPSLPPKPHWLESGTEQVRDEATDNANNGTTAFAIRGKVNDDEIDLSEDEDISTAPTQSGQVNVAKPNADELDLDLEEDTEEPARIVPQQPEDQTMSSTEEARALLPEAFRRPKENKTVELGPHPPDITNHRTDFLALDKCVPNKHFLQLLDVPATEPVTLERPFKLMYDPEWLAITRTWALDEGTTFGGDPYDRSGNKPKTASFQELVEQRRSWIDAELYEAQMTIPENFEVVAPVYDGGDWNKATYSDAQEYPNPQTAQFCKLIGVENPLEASRPAKTAFSQGHRNDDANYQEHRRTNHTRGGRGGRGGRGRGRGRGWGGGGRSGGY